jgi:hypothetical protein
MMGISIHAGLQHFGEITNKKDNYVEEEKYHY